MCSPEPSETLVPLDEHTVHSLPSCYPKQALMMSESHFCEFDFGLSHPVHYVLNLVRLIQSDIGPYSSESIPQCNLLIASSGMPLK